MYKLLRIFLYRTCDKQVLIYKTPHSQNVRNIRTISRNIANVMFGKYLLTTNIISSGVLMFLGDLMCQELEIERKKPLKGRSVERTDKEHTYDWSRAKNMFIVGSLQGPLHHYFYGWMDRTYGPVNLANVSKKIMIDQFVMSPACIILFFFPAGFLEGQSLSECVQELREKFLTVYMTDWLVWPIAQFLNFYYLHPKYRVLYINVITMLYNIFLSYIKYHDHTESTSI